MSVSSDTVSSLVFRGLDFSVVDSDNVRNGLVIRAINQDNQRDAEELVELFRNQYGDSYPFAEVYQTNYWRQERDDLELDKAACLKPFTSIVALDGRRVVAHLALQPLGDGIVEILHPSIHPDYRHRLFSISRLFGRCLQEQAQRQNWRIVFGYNYICQPLAQILATKFLFLKETALIPGFAPVGEKFAAMRSLCPKKSLLAMYNTPLARASAEKTLYPPAEHIEKIIDLYRPFSFNRRFLSVNPEPQYSAMKHSDSPDANNGLSLTYEQSLGIARVIVDPGEIEDWEEFLSFVSDMDLSVHRQDLRLVIQVAMDSPSCPRCSRMLELNGYRFCGVLPEVAGQDYIVFCRYRDADIKHLNLYTRRAKGLQEYMIHSTNKQESFRFL